MVRAKTAEGSRLHFWCPGCDGAHGIAYGDAGPWGWDGNVERPTIAGSVLLYESEHLIDPNLEGPALTAPENVRVSPRCHSFVVDGKIQFLDDCTHALRGQTVDLPEWPYG